MLESSYRQPTFLVVWDVLYGDGRVSTTQRHRVIRGQTAVREFIGRLKLPVETWRDGECTVLGRDGVLTGRGTNIDVFDLSPSTVVVPSDVPPGWTARSANKG